MNHLPPQRHITKIDYRKKKRLLTREFKKGHKNLKMSYKSKVGLKRQNLCSGPLTVYQDLSTCRDWPVKKAIVDLPIRLKGNSKIAPSVIC